MKLIFEKSCNDHSLSLLPPLDVETALPSENSLRQEPLNLPQMAEIDISRHYTELANQTHGINNGFYPLGSCTMKYNPKIDEDMAALEKFVKIHPLQPESTVQGCLEVISRTQDALCEITGMDDMTFQGAAGAHGEFCGLLLIKAYHQSRNDFKRTKIIVPDSAHGTNPASASMAGFSIVSIPSNDDGCVDIEKLRAAVGEDTAGLMLTNPNTVGLFDKNILEITKIVHDAGGLNYYDGANLNAIMGVVRPGDMGFDVIHLNLHKTFATPHGGGGPGSGAIGCKANLSPFMPKYCVKKVNDRYEFYDPQNTIGSIKEFYGNFLVVVKALTYITTLGAEGIRSAAQNAVLNANYMRVKLSDLYTMAYDKICMHEFVITLESLKHEYGVSALDIAKTILDNGMHPPTMYFPLIVHEALMVEPTETESKDTLDKAIEIYRRILITAKENPALVHSSPVNAPIGRPNEVEAARNPKLKYQF